MNGIKLIFVISRYFKSDEKIVYLLTSISNEICQRIEDQFTPEKVFIIAKGKGPVDFYDEQAVQI